MDINDYLIPQPGKDWTRLLAEWTPPLPAAFSLWLVNRLGDVILFLKDGKVWLLEVGTGNFTEVASSRAHFAQLLDTGDNAERWLRIRLVDACRRAGIHLAADECYGFKIPPTLGGTYEPANLTPTRLAVHYSYQAYICKQTAIYWIPPT